MSSGRRLFFWPVIAALLLAAPLAAAAPAPEPAGSAPFDPYILTAIEAQGEAEFYVVLKAQADLSAAAALPAKAAKGQFVFDALTQVAARTQAPLLASLSARKAEFRPYWIRNMVRVRGDKALLLQMAARPNVAEIVYEYPAVPDAPQPGRPSEADQTSGATAVEWNIARVNADDVWALGITGQGAVVADLDTGADWQHPALAATYRPQIPGAPTRHDYNWYDGPNGSPVPKDYQSHGTHTLGTMVGDDGAGHQIGMAPGAQWIACAGLGTSATPTDCFQFFLAPTRLDGTAPRPDLAPDVINNSWTSATDYHAIIQALTAAGTFLSKSAGNSGSGCGTITNPGQWPELTTVGAFQQNDSIYFYSSRGPVAIGHDTLVKPDLAAPGVNVRSSVPGGAYALLSGTSMAAPHVAGAVALLIAAQPELAGATDVLQKLLYQTAVPRIDAQCAPGTGRPNNVWGWGTLDALAAVQAAQAMGLGTLAGRVTEAASGLPVAAAALAFEDPAAGWRTADTSGTDGRYDHLLPAATYAVTATQYGYLPAVATGVAVAGGATSTLDLALAAAPLWAVAGHVTEAGTLAPLAAEIAFEQTPVTAATDAGTGAYAALVAQGTWWMNVSSPGHAAASRRVSVTGDRTEDWSLPPIHNYYVRTAGQCGGGPLAWLDATGGTARSLGDDSAQFVALPAGRMFEFYGQTYGYLYVGSNGTVLFGVGNGQWSGPIPDPAPPNNGIYAFSTDLNPAAGTQGKVYTAYLQNRYFVIEWLQVQHYPSGNPETFEVILDLDTNAVRVQYLAVSDATDAVVGVENATGSEATQYAYRDPGRILAGVALDFVPAFGTPPAATGDGRVRGAVTDAEAGTPIGYAHLRARAGSTGATFSFAADSGGVYDAPLCPDDYDLAAAAPGYHPSITATVPVIAGDVSVQDFALVPAHADLWLTKSGPATVYPGQLVTYTLAFGSKGPDEAAAAQVRDVLPPAVAWVSGGTYQAAGHSVTWPRSAVGSGYAGNVQLVVRVLPDAAPGEMCNTASFQATGTGAPVDPYAVDNSDLLCTTIRPWVRAYLPLLLRNQLAP